MKKMILGLSALTLVLAACGGRTEVGALCATLANDPETMAGYAELDFSFQDTCDCLDLTIEGLSETEQQIIFAGAVALNDKITSDEITYEQASFAIMEQARSDQSNDADVKTAQNVEAFNMMSMDVFNQMRRSGGQCAAG